MRMKHRKNAKEKQIKGECYRKRIRGRRRRRRRRRREREREWKIHLERE